MGNAVSFRANSFFDRRAVRDALGKANAAALGKAGAYIRRTAKGLIRKAKGPAKPGKPPHSHVGTLKNLIYFSFDSGSMSVVVGPTPFNGPAVAPRALELGGSIPARINGRRRHRAIGGAGEIRIDEGRQCKNTKRVKDHRGGVRLVSYAYLGTAAQAARSNDLNEELYGPQFLGPAPLAARPYMGPALAAELPHLPPLWANSVH